MKTLQQIFAERSDDVQAFLNGGELSYALYDELFNHYCNTGEMPYGTATATSGDPYAWIEEKLESIAADVEVYDRVTLPLAFA